MFDLLRELGPMTVEDLAQRHTGSSEEVALCIWKSSCSKINLPSDDQRTGASCRYWMMPPGCVMPLGVRLPESLPEIYFDIESVTRFATSFCAISGSRWLWLNNWLTGFFVSRHCLLSSSSFSNCVNRVW
ncbi:hypothetical protein ACLB1T_28540 [Escherichia coli]